MKKSAAIGDVLRGVCAGGKLLAVCVAMTTDAWAADVPWAAVAGEVKAVTVGYAQSESAKECKVMV